MPPKSFTIFILQALHYSLFKQKAVTLHFKKRTKNRFSQYDRKQCKRGRRKEESELY